jgi:hypothetical protein
MAALLKKILILKVGQAVMDSSFKEASRSIHSPWIRKAANESVPPSLTD